MLSKLFLYPSCTAVVINHEAHVFLLFKHVPQNVGWYHFQHTLLLHLGYVFYITFHLFFQFSFEISILP